MEQKKYLIQDTKYKIRSFKDLETWKQAHKLVLYVYKLSAKFPRYELHSLADQMRRASVSITSNIAEGFTRETKKEKVRFYTISLGSSLEIENQLQIALDLKYIDLRSFNFVNKQINIVQKMLYGMIKSSKSK